MALIRPPHLLLMHAFRHRLDVNLALNTFHCITHFIVPARGKIYMPFGHVITEWLETQGIEVNQEGAIPLTQSDRLSTRNFTLAGLRVEGGTLIWGEGRGAGPDAVAAAPDTDSEEDFQTDTLALLEVLRIDHEKQSLRLDTLEQGIHSRFGALEHSTSSRFDALEQRQIQMEQRQLEALGLLRSLAQPRPPTAEWGAQFPEAHDFMDIGDDDRDEV